MSCHHGMAAAIRPGSRACPLVLPCWHLASWLSSSHEYTLAPCPNVSVCPLQPKFVMRFILSMLLQPGTFLEHTLW